MAALDKKHEELLEESQQVKRALLAKIDQLEKEQKQLTKRLTELEGTENKRKEQLDELQRAMKEKVEEEQELTMKVTIVHEEEKTDKEEKATQWENREDVIKLELVKRVREQRTTALHWQYRVDRALEHWLCHRCQNAKIDAFSNGVGYTWLPECDLPDCGVAKSCLQAGLPGHNGEDEFVSPRYWCDDDGLKEVEKELAMNLGISLANLDQAIEKEKKEDAVEGEKKLLHHIAKAMTDVKIPQPHPVDLHLQQEKVTLLHEWRQQRTLALH